MYVSNLPLTLPGSLNLALPGALLAVLISTMASSVSAAPTVTNPTLTYLDSVEAVVTSSVTSLDGGKSLERGFVYAMAATNQDPLLSGTGVTKVVKAGSLGSFSLSLLDLSPATTYAVKSFIRTSRDTAYSSVLFFTTDTDISFTSGIGTLSNRAIGVGENQSFDVHIEDSSAVSFSGTGASGSMTWELRDELSAVVASGTGNLSFAGPLAWGDYQLRVSNPGVSSESFSLSLDISNLVNPRPDISVGLDPSAPSGVDIYGPASLDQYALTTTNMAKSKEVFFLVDNDGALPDSMRVSATPSNNLFTVSYFIAGSNQTAAVIAGIATTTRIGSDDAPVSVRAKIAPDLKNSRIKETVVINGRRVAIYGRESYCGTMRVTSSTDYTISDTARFKLNTLP